MDKEPLFKHKIEEFANKNPNIIEDSKKRIDEYGTVIKKDERGRVTYIKDKNGNEKIWKYGKFGIEYHKDTIKGLEEYHSYDENGNRIKYENSNGNIVEYDNKERIIAEWDKEGNKKIYEYDEDDRVIYEEINDKIAIKTVYLHGAFETFVYTYNSETDMVSIEYKNFLNFYKSYMILENGTEQWFENFEKIKEIEKIMPLKNK